MSFNLFKTSQRLKLSRNSSRIVALLENARDLAVIHQQRPQAAQVVTRASEFARSIHQTALADSLLTLAGMVRGKNSLELNERFDDACHGVITSFEP